MEATSQESRCLAVSLLLPVFGGRRNSLACGSSFPILASVFSFHVSVLTLSYRDTKQTGLRAHLLQYDLLLTNDIFNNPISKLGHILRYWGLRQDFDFVFLGGHNLTHNMALGSKGTEIHLNKLLFPPKGNRLNECFLGTRSWPAWNVLKRTLLKCGLLEHRGWRSAL